MKKKSGKMKTMSVLGGLKDQSPKFQGAPLKPRESNVTRKNTAPTPRTLPGRNC